jgi:hypothetical protein
MAEKKCRYCAMMIPKEAKICPHCRKRLGWTWPAKIFLGFIIFTVIGIIASQNKNSSVPTKSSEKRTQIKEVQLTEKAKLIKQKHPDWSNDTCNTIAGKKIFIGMTKEQAIASWGKPFKINTTHTQYGDHEQWVMYDSVNSDYLYFEKGKLTSIQQFRSGR